MRNFSKKNKKRKVKSIKSKEQKSFVVKLASHTHFEKIFQYLHFLGSSFLTHDLGHDILEHYNVLIQTRLTTSKTKRDI